MSIDPQYGKGQCRVARLRYEFLLKFINLLEIEYLQSTPTEFVDLFTGKALYRIEKSQGKDRSGVTEPKLVREAMASIDLRPFVRDAIVEFLQQRKADFHLQTTALGQNRYIAKYLNDLLCWAAVQNQKPIQTAGGNGTIWKYKAAYRVQKTGRIGEIRGGFQNASREMKAAAYEGIANLHNYDLKSSQVNGLIQQFELADLETHWLKDYRDYPNAKQYYSDALGVDIDTWKDCFIALLMGARSIKAGPIYRNLRHYCEETGQPDSTADELLNRFNELTDPLQKQLSRWHRFLLGGYLTTDYAYRYAGKRYLRNPTGKKLCVDDLKGNRSGKVAAFVLQGQEAAFIHWLTLLSCDYDFDVVGNEHDGLITIGTIPDEAVNEAATRSGLKHASLSEKPFFTPSSRTQREVLRSSEMDSHKLSVDDINELLKNF